MDATLRTTERLAATGDVEARRQLGVLRQRQGLAGFEAAAAEWLVGAQKIVDRVYNRPLQRSVRGELVEIVGSVTYRTLTFEPGRRYWRVVSTTNGQRGAFGFLDVQTGAVLKTASWKGPAKHARGNLFDEHGGLSWVGPYGIASIARGGR